MMIWCKKRRAMRAVQWLCLFICACMLTGCSACGQPAGPADTSAASDPSGTKASMSRVPSTPKPTDPSASAEQSTAAAASAATETRPSGQKPTASTAASTAAQPTAAPTKPSAPSEPTEPTAPSASATLPTGFDDDSGWSPWID